jgi:general secretion pathway protein G
MTPPHAKRGFSLIELLVVLAIMAVLASIALPLTELAHQRQKEEDLRRALREIRSAIDAYKRLVDQGRIPKPAGTSGYPPSLDVLIQGITDAQSPQGSQIYLLRKLPPDPMALTATPIQPAAQTWSLRSYASPPDAPAAGEDVFDIHSAAPGQGLNGIPYHAW